MPTVCEIGPQEVFGILRDQSPEQRLQKKSLLPKVVYFLHLEDLIFFLNINAFLIFYQVCHSLMKVTSLWVDGPQIVDMIHTDF